MTTPEFLPVLKAGKHRSARRGACFMEYASVLAGERFSDHPNCTHPALAALARAVNDLTSDRHRGDLAPLVPSVVGLLPQHPSAGPALAVLAASTAMPISAEFRQRALACGLLSLVERLGDTELDDRLREEAAAALATAPVATAWARDYLERSRPPRRERPKEAERRIEAMLQLAAVGIAAACIDEPWRRMRELLERAVDRCAEVDATLPTDRTATLRGELTEASPALSA